VNSRPHVCYAAYARTAGFTLVELLLALVILGVLVAIAVPSYSKYRDRAMIAQAVNDIAGMNVQLQQYLTENHHVAPDLSAIGASGKLDPWGRPYVYTDIETAGVGGARKDKNLVPINTEFDLYSVGKDGASALPITASQSRDDVILANDGKYIGLASDYE
jgi:general secretion pathway protein G